MSNTFDILVIKDDSVSDGADYNLLAAEVKGDNGEQAIGVDVVFMINGTSIFQDNNSKVIKKPTDDNGVVRVSVCNSSLTNYTDTVVVFLMEDQATKKNVNIHFTEPRVPFVIDSVTSKNKTLSAGEPTIMWQGAEFSIKTSGGSGDVEWTSDSMGIDIRCGKSVAYLSAIYPLVGDVNIQGRDTITDEYVSYKFTLSEFISYSQGEMVFKDMIDSGIVDSVLSKESFTRLFHQWGKLGDYTPWLSGEEYWTSDYNEFSAWVANPDTGDFRTLNIEKNSMPYILYEDKDNN